MWRTLIEGPVCCPFCGQRYDVKYDGARGLVAVPDGLPCSHIVIYPFPEVWFREGDSDPYERGCV
jgi:hypothetical protein